jgi:hypothetical protein
VSVFQDLMLDAAEFAACHFGGIDLGDKRRNARGVRMAAAMAAQPGASIPKQMGDAHQAKAAYRLLDTPDLVTFHSMAGFHWEKTRREVRALEQVLLLGDTSEIDYTGHPGVTGLELIGNGRGRGMNLHTVLAVDPAKGGQLQGVAWQQVFYRQAADRGKEKQDKPEDRASRVWADSVKGCGSPAAGKRFVHVTDNGSDDFSYFLACAATGSDFLCRIYQPRKAALGHEATAGERSVTELARSLPALGGKTLELRGRSGQKKKVKVEGKRHASTVVRDVPGRVAKLLVSASAVTVFPPADGSHGTEPLKLWVVRVWEPNPPAGTDAIEWVLLTSLPVPDLEHALKMAEWYGYRWLIEEYHKCLKTGCRIEQRQLENADRLEALLGINVVIAARLLAIKQQATQNPTTPAVDVVDELTVKVLIAKKKLKVKAAEMTVYAFWREVAKLGGFLGRKGDGNPGWQTLWIGWLELQTLVEGARLALAEVLGEISCG